MSLSQAKMFFWTLCSPWGTINQARFCKGCIRLMTKISQYQDISRYHIRSLITYTFKILVCQRFKPCPWHPHPKASPESLNSSGHKVTIDANDVPGSTVVQAAIQKCTRFGVLSEQSFQKSLVNLGDASG